MNKDLSQVILGCFSVGFIAGVTLKNSILEVQVLFLSIHILLFRPLFPSSFRVWRDVLGVVIR